MVESSLWTQPKCSSSSNRELEVSRQIFNKRRQCLRVYNNSKCIKTLLRRESHQLDLHSIKAAASINSMAHSHPVHLIFWKEECQCLALLIKLLSPSQVGQHFRIRLIKDLQDLDLHPRDLQLQTRVLAPMVRAVQILNQSQHHFRFRILQVLFWEAMEPLTLALSI